MLADIPPVTMHSPMAAAICAAQVDARATMNADGCRATRRLAMRLYRRRRSAGLARVKVLSFPLQAPETPTAPRLDS